MNSLQQLQEQIDRSIQATLGPAKNFGLGYQPNEIERQFELQRRLLEVQERSWPFKDIHDLMGRTSIASQAKRYMEDIAQKHAYTELENYARSVQLSQTSALDIAAMRHDHMSDIHKQYEESLRSVFQQDEMLAKIQRQIVGDISISEYARKWTAESTAFQAIEMAKTSLDHFWPSLRDTDLSQFEINEEDEHDVRQAAETLTQAVTQQESLHDVIKQIVLAIQAQQKPAVQLMLLAILFKVMDWLISGAIGAAMGWYSPAILGEGPQAAKKAVQESARIVVGSTELLVEYRYVKAQLLTVRRNPGARSPEIGRLPFASAVKILKKEKDFTLVLWTDKSGEGQIEGWVFSRYLGKFD